MKINELIASIPKDKLLHFVAGLLCSAVVAFVVPTGRWWCVAGAVLAGIGKEVVDQLRYRGFDWRDMAATIAGGVVIQILAILSLLC